MSERIRSKRNPRSSRKAEARAAYKSRTGGGLDDYEITEDDAIYDLVDEEEYRELVDKRRKREDFVVDDDGLGYHDDGEEYFGGGGGQQQQVEEAEDGMYGV